VGGKSAPREAVPCPRPTISDTRLSAKTPRSNLQRFFCLTHQDSIHRHDAVAPAATRIFVPLPRRVRTDDGVVVEFLVGDHTDCHRNAFLEPRHGDKHSILLMRSNCKKHTIGTGDWMGPPMDTLLTSSNFSCTHRNNEHLRLWGSIVQE
jgi:hypothetical protein